MLPVGLLATPAVPVILNFSRRSNSDTYKLDSAATVANVYGGSNAEPDPLPSGFRPDRRRSSLPGFVMRSDSIADDPFSSRRHGHRRCSTRHAGVINEARMELRSAKQR